jgi:hypothetical protein
MRSPNGNSHYARSFEVQRLPRNLHVASHQSSSAGESYERGHSIIATEADIGRQRFGLTFDK